MRRHDVTRSLVQLTRLRMSNCYLVRDEDGLTLIDTSFRGSTDAILGYASSLGQIRRVAITHAHHDHAGSLEDLKARLPDAEFAIHEREAALIRGDLSAPEGEPAGRLRGYLFEKADLAFDRHLSAGDRVGSLEVIAAPGHTPGHVAFWDPRDGTLIAGDAYLAIGELFVTTELVARFPFPALSGTWHAPTALETAERLIELAPARIATGHGRVVEQPVEDMRRALARARRKRAWG